MNTSEGKGHKWHSDTWKLNDWCHYNACTLSSVTAREQPCKIREELLSYFTWLFPVTLLRVWHQPFNFQVSECNLCPFPSKVFIYACKGLKTTKKPGSEEVKLVCVDSYAYTRRGYLLKNPYQYMKIKIYSYKYLRETWGESMTVEEKLTGDRSKAELIITNTAWVYL